MHLSRVDGGSAERCKGSELTLSCGATDTKSIPQCSNWSITTLANPNRKKEPTDPFYVQVSRRPSGACRKVLKLRTGYCWRLSRPSGGSFDRSATNHWVLGEQSHCLCRKNMVAHLLGGPQQTANYPPVRTRPVFCRLRMYTDHHIQGTNLTLAMIDSQGSTGGSADGCAQTWPGSAKRMADIWMQT